jgi:hypothetical protein
MQKMMLAALGLVVFMAMVSLGCGGGSDTNAATSSASGTTSSSSGAGGAGGEGSGGAGGAGGAGGEAAESGKSATETVTAGEVSKSPNYKMLFTFGQPTQNQGTTKSPGYRMQGGLVGANGGSK